MRSQFVSYPSASEPGLIAKTGLTSHPNLVPRVFSFSNMTVFSPAAAILENEKTLGTRLQPTDAQGTHSASADGFTLVKYVVIIIIIIIIIIILICSLKR